VAPHLPFYRLYLLLEGTNKFRYRAIIIEFGQNGKPNSVCMTSLVSVLVPAASSSKMLVTCILRISGTVVTFDPFRNGAEMALAQYGAVLKTKIL